MREVSYFAPTEVGEAVKLLAQHGAKATILAGGTDLLPKINHYEFAPEVLVYVGGLGLNYIREADGKLAIGATATTAQLAADPLVAGWAGALTEAARLSGSSAIQTAATIGGNIANASPAADLVAPLVALDAELVLKSAAGERVVPIKDFFVGPHATVRKPNELLVEIRIPKPKGKTVFVKVGRRKAQTLSVINVAARLEMDGAVCKQARIVLGSMAPTPLRCTKAEGLLQGKKLDKALIEQAAAAAVAESSPITDQRATEWYRKQAGTGVAALALAQAAGIES